MTVRKRDFQRVVHEVKEFITKLKGNETTAELRDSLNFSLLLLHKYYKRLRNKSKKLPLLDGSISLSSSLGSLSPASPYIPPQDKFEWRWVNLDPSKLNASFGHGDRSNLLPEVFHVLKEADVERLKELIEKDNDCVNELDPLGRSTALYCIHGNSPKHLECLNILMENNVDLNHEANDGATCLHVAAIQDNEKIFDRVLSLAKDLVHAEDSEGRYPLHFAAGYSSAAIVQKLLLSGADKNCLDNNELTPVMWACHFDKYENVELLLQIKGDDEMRFETIDLELKDVDAKGQCLLHWCVTRSINRTCFQILFCDQYIDVADNDGKTVLHLIAENGAASAAQEYFAICGEQEIDILDKHKRSALHYACMFGHGEIVDILLSKGASLEIADKNGITPYEYAKSKNLHYCMLVVQSYEKYRGVHKQPDENMNGNTVINEVQPSHGKKTKTQLENENPHNRQTSANEKRNIPVLTITSTDTSSLHPDLLTSPKETETTEFDTPQNENHIVAMRPDSIEPIKQEVGNIKGTHNETEDGNFDYKSDNSVVSEDAAVLIDDVDSGDINLNDQMIVLVEHHGSDDEIVINVNNDSEPTDKSEDNSVFLSERKNTTKNNKSIKNELISKETPKAKSREKHVPVDVDDDEADSMPFARNGNITTVSGHGDASAVFNSISVNPSVSSLGNSSDNDSEDDGDFNVVKTKASKGNSHKKNKHEKLRDKNKKFTPNFTDEDIDDENFPPFQTSSSDNYSSVVAPMPPPPSANYQLPVKNNMQPLTIHDKRSRSVSNSLKLETPFGNSDHRISKKSNKSLGQSWPSMSSSESISPNTSLMPLQPMRSSSVKLAPINTKMKPKPPKLK